MLMADGTGGDGSDSNLDRLEFKAVFGSVLTGSALNSNLDRLEFKD